VQTTKLHQQFAAALKEVEAGEPRSAEKKQALLESYVNTILDLPFDPKASGDVTRILNEFHQYATGGQPTPAGKTLREVLDTIGSGASGRLLRERPAEAAVLAAALNALGLPGTFTFDAGSASIKATIPPNAFSNLGTISYELKVGSEKTTTKGEASVKRFTVGDGCGAGQRTASAS
jgi:hypothetical protein